MSDPLLGAEALEPAVADRSASVEVDDRPDPTGERPRPGRVTCRDVIGADVDDVVDAVRGGDDGTQRFGAGEDQSRITERPAQPAQGGNDRQHVAESQSTQSQDDLLHSTSLPAAILFDRDDTLIDDVPYNGDPSLVTVKGEAARALDLVRERGIPVGVISNQSGVGRGLITAAQVTAVNARVAELLGPFDVWCWCPHVSDDGCECRKPQPGMLLAAAGELGVDVTETVMIGDIAADMAAAKAAGARGILVPTARTLNPEIAAAAEVASDLVEAVEMALTPERRAG